MPELEHTFSPALPIPDFLVSEVQSKLAYVDENIRQAQVAPAGDRITLYLQRPADQPAITELEEKTQRVVLSMVKGAFKLKVQVLEDRLDRPVPYSSDPHSELLARGEISPEAEGIYTLGPLLSRLILYFESLFLELADTFSAEPYRFPTLIPARYLERVNYFQAFP